MRAREIDQRELAFESSLRAVIPALSASTPRAARDVLVEGLDAAGVARSTCDGSARGPSYRFVGGEHERSRGGEPARERKADPA